MNIFNNIISTLHELEDVENFEDLGVMVIDSSS